MTAPDEVPADDPASDRLTALWRREWYLLVRPALDHGHDVMVLDPDVERHETWSLDGDVVLEVYPCVAEGWQIIIRQVEADPLEDE